MAPDCAEEFHIAGGVLVARRDELGCEITKRFATIHDLRDDFDFGDVAEDLEHRIAQVRALDELEHIDRVLSDLGRALIASQSFALPQTVFSRSSAVHP